VIADSWGTATAAADPASVEAWNTAWIDALHFVNDPFDTLAHANAHDAEFAMGSVFCGTYRILGGAPFDTPEVLLDLQRATERAGAPRETAHASALAAMVRGDFTAAARIWDRIARDHHDFAAVRFAHDVYLHVGNAGARLRSSEFAMALFDGRPGWNLVASQYAFALEEAGVFDEAERVAWEALESDPLDLWATHALAHVYESIENQTAALELLRSRQPTWSAQDGLAVHIWWHLGLRLLAGGDFDEVLGIHDRLVPDAKTPFRLCDLTSLLWRLELHGVDVGDRWDHLADAFAARPERHTCGFLDLHQSLVYTRRPDHPSGHEFFAGINRSGERADAENDDTFRTVVCPLIDAIRLGEADPSAAALELDRLQPVVHRIGGSNAQRDLVELTRQHLDPRPNEPTTVLETT
jgi:tetratricopeptide (TPR) repeat protein